MPGQRDARLDRLRRQRHWAGRADTGRGDERMAAQLGSCRSIRLIQGVLQEREASTVQYQLKGFKTNVSARWGLNR